MTLFQDRPLVYVAGPYVRPDPVANTHRAIKAGDFINAHGQLTAYVPHLTLQWHLVCPHGDTGDQSYWYDYDLSMVRRCDAVIRIPGDSSGADKEVEYASLNKVPVYAWNDREDQIIPDGRVRSFALDTIALNLRQLLNQKAVNLAKRYPSEGDHQRALTSERRQ